MTTTMETPRSKYMGGPSSPIKTSPLKNSTATPVFGQPTEHVPASPFALSTRSIHASYNHNAYLSSHTATSPVYRCDELAGHDSLAKKSSFVSATTPANRRAGFSHRHSPSMPDLGAAITAAAADGAIASAVASPLDAFRSKHTRSGSTNSNNSDVQGIVARFNRLEIRDRERDRERDRDHNFAASVNGSNNAGLNDSSYGSKHVTGEKLVSERPRAAREDVLAIKRAEMAREAAEAEARRSNEEVRRLREELQAAVSKVREEGRKHSKEVEDVRDRERRQYKRLEVIIEELNRTRESSAYTIASLEKGIRTKSKEYFKVQSAYVKGLEEIKSTRAALRVARSAVNAEKQKLDQREQETFSAQYKLIGTQEALTCAQERLKVLEAERDALKTSLKEEEVARVAAEGRIALPVPRRSRGGVTDRTGAEEEIDEDEEDDDIDFFTDGYNMTHGISPLKSSSKRAHRAAATLDALEADDAGSDKENASSPSRNNFHTKSTSHPNLRLYQDQHHRRQRESRPLQQQQSSQQQQINFLRFESEIANERARREQAEETVKFLKMECQFRCCSCRVAEEKEAKYVFDGSMAEGMEVVRREAREAMQTDRDNDLDMDVGDGESKYVAPGDSKIAIAGEEPPIAPSGAASATEGMKDYFSLVPAGEDSRMLDKSGITPDEEIDTKQNDTDAGLAESAEARAASLCFSPTSGTFRSASIASASSSSAGASSVPNTVAPTADTSFDSDQSSYATPPVSMDRSSNHGRVLPFKPLLDTIPSHPASPYQDGHAVEQESENHETTGKTESARHWPTQESTEFARLNNNNDEDDEMGKTYKSTERYYTPAEELDIRTIEDEFGIDNNGKYNNNDSNILVTQAHERELEAGGAETDTDSLTNSNTVAEPQTPVSVPAARGRFMLRTVTTTTQVPLQSTPATRTTNNSDSYDNNSSSDNGDGTGSDKIVTTPHHHFNHKYNYPSTAGPRPQDRRHHDHTELCEYQPPTPMTAPLPPSSMFTADADNCNRQQQQQQHSHYNDHNHHHPPIDRAAALAQIQARRGRARSLAEGLQQQQQQQQQNGMTPRSGAASGQTTTPAGSFTAAHGNGNGNGNRIIKRDTRDISAPALKGRGF